MDRKSDKLADASAASVHAPTDLSIRDAVWPCLEAVLDCRMTKRQANTGSMVLSRLNSG
jgi:hypothetical protein